MTTPTTPADTPSLDAERAALEELLASEGWAFVEQLVQRQYGDSAQIAHIDAAMSKLQPGDDQLAVVTQIRASSKAAFGVLALVRERVNQLKAGEKREAKGFDRFRRRPR